jgi:hypothetical protein
MDEATEHKFWTPVVNGFDSTSNQPIYRNANDVVERGLHLYLSDNDDGCSLDHINLITNVIPSRISTEINDNFKNLTPPIEFLPLSMIDLINHTSFLMETKSSSAGSAHNLNNHEQSAAKEQPLHFDSNYDNSYHPSCCSVIYALQDNTYFRVVPGSHQYDNLDQLSTISDKEEFKSALVKLRRGQYLVMHPKLMHSGWGNTCGDNLRCFYAFDGTIEKEFLKSIAEPNANAHFVPDVLEFFPQINSKITNQIKMEAQMSSLYSLLNIAVDPGSDGTGILVEVKVGSMQNLMEHLQDLCEFNENSRFLDVGSGCGRPVLHAAVAIKPKLSIGVEVHPLIYGASVGCLKRFWESNTFDEASKIGTNFLEHDMEDPSLTSLVSCMQDNSNHNYHCNNM